jgi:hypothetical protein
VKTAEVFDRWNSDCNGLKKLLGDNLTPRKHFLLKNKKAEKDYRANSQEMVGGSSGHFKALSVTSNNK